MYWIRNHLGIISHVAAGLASYTWIVALTDCPPLHPVIALLVAFFALLPDIDTQASHLGRLWPTISGYIERHIGHREATHSLLAVGLIALFTWLIYPEHLAWLALTSAYGSHLLLDMIIGGGVGIPLLWPARMRAYFLEIQAASTGEALVAGVLCALAAMPLLTPAITAAVTQFVITPPATPTLTPTPTLHLASVRVPHVYDLSEIAVSVGDHVEIGDLLADLRTHRQFIATPTPTLTPTPETPKTPAPANLNPIAVAQAEAELSLAQARYAAAIATPTPDPMLLATLREEQAAVSNGIQERRDALHRCQQENACGDWRYQIAAQELATLEIQATSVAQQLNAELYPESDALAVEIAKAQLALAETRHAAAVATPTPVQPTATPRPGNSPQETRDEIDDETRIHALITGQVIAVRIASITGNTAVVEIVIVIE